MAEQDQPQIFRNRYKMVKKLGAGNFGTAYLVTDLKAKNELKVLKVVRLGEMDSDQTVDSVREAKLLSNLHNDYIVKFYESFLENDYLGIVTEYCEGGDLDQRFKEMKKKNTSLDENQIVLWLIQILIAVQYMHKSRVLHRDLKARNIFLKSNQVKIGDFGISRILVGTMDVANTFTGTPYYMSPEVMKHDGYESKSDIWSVGCLLYEMCTYQHAFDGKGLMNVIYKVVEGTPPQLPSTYSPQLNELLQKMFIKDPKQRPSAAELLQTSFLQENRKRMKVTATLENTISADNRLKNLRSQLQDDMSYGDMIKQSWSLPGESNNAVEEIEDLNYDDDDDVKSIINTIYRRAQQSEQADDKFSGINEEQTFKTARQTMAERKINQADARGQAITEAIRSSVHVNATNRQMMRDSTIIGTMHQPWPSAAPGTKSNEKTLPQYSKTMHGRIQGEYTVNNDDPQHVINDTTYAVRPDIRLSATSRQRGFKNNDDRPITPMRTTYRQVAAKFSDEDGLPTDPNLTDEYYAAYDDFEKYDEHNQAHENDDAEISNNVLRSLNGEQVHTTARPSSGTSRSSTMNSLSRTIDPRQTAPMLRQSKYVNSSTSLKKTNRPNSSTRITNEEVTNSFKDNPSRDAFGPLARQKKIDSLREKSIEILGKSKFIKVHDYLLEKRKAQRVDPTLDDAEITDGLRSFVSKITDCFLLDQLVFLELFNN